MTFRSAVVKIRLFFSDHNLSDFLLWVSDHIFCYNQSSVKKKKKQTNSKVLLTQCIMFTHRVSLYKQLITNRKVLDTIGSYDALHSGTRALWWTVVLVLVMSAEVSQLADIPNCLVFNGGYRTRAHASEAVSPHSTEVITFLILNSATVYDL